MKDVLLLFSVTNRIERMVERSHIQTHFYWNKAANLVVMWQFTLDNNVVLHARRDIVSGMVLGSIFFFFFYIYVGPGHCKSEDRPNHRTSMWNLML